MLDDDSFVTTMNIAWQYEEFKQFYYVLDLRNDTWTVLKESAALLWGCIVRFDTIKTMVQNLVMEYQIDEAVARKDITDFLNMMIENGFISKN